MWHTRTSTEVDFPMLTDIANTDLWMGSSGLAQMGIGYSTQKPAGFLKPGWYLWIETVTTSVLLSISRNPGIQADFSIPKLNCSKSRHWKNVKIFSVNSRSNN